VCSNPNWSLWVKKFSRIFVFLSKILATDMLESHSRALKDTDFCLVSEKNLGQKNGSIG